MRKQELKCYKCKEHKDRENFSLVSFKERNYGKWDKRVGICKECEREKKRIYYKTDKGKYSSYIRACRKNNREFKLTFDEFVELLHGKCFYCNSSNKIGIDRIKNNIGYIKDNCVSCCWICNEFKGRRDDDIFIGMITKIYENINN